MIQRLILPFLLITIGLSASAQDKFYWTDATVMGINRSNVDGTSDESFLASGDNYQGIAIDPGSGKFYVADAVNQIIYWGDISDPAGTFAVLIDNTILGGGSELRGIALDLSNGHLFWADNGTNRIGRANLDGSSPDDTFITGVVGVHDIAIDEINGYIYWSRNQGTSQIWRAPVSTGSPTTQLRNDPGSEFLGIALDLKNTPNKIYWADGAGTISRADLDGSNPESMAVITSGATDGSDIEIDNSRNSLFYANTIDGVIESFDLTTFSSTPLVTNTSTFLTTPRFLALGYTPQDCPTVNAGPDQVACQSDAVSLSAAIGGIASSVSWFTTGDGSFDNNTSLTPSYSPGALDASNGTVTLVVITDDPAGPCSAATDDMIITVSPEATVSAGIDQLVCEGSPVLLNGTIGGAASGSLWSSGGDGSFDDSSLLNAAYTPGTNDILAGTVILTLTAEDPDGAGPCSSVTSSLTISIEKVPEISVQPSDVTTCDGNAAMFEITANGAVLSYQWEEDLGGGFSAISDGGVYTGSTTSQLSISDVTGLDGAMYRVVLAEVGSPGMCHVISAEVLLSAGPQPTAVAGANQTVCENDQVLLNGTIGGAATSAVWSTSGDGTFDDNTLLNAVYSPGPSDIASGSVALTLSTDDPDGAGPCTAVSSSLTVNITPAASAEAGDDQTICETEIVQLNATFGGSASGILWMTSGSGTFSDPTDPLATYTPGGTDLGSTITLKLTTDDPAGPCVPAEDSLMVSITITPTVDAGPDQTICEGEPASLTGITGGSAISGTWTTSGEGSFADASSLSTTYTPAGTDIGNTIILTLTTEDPDGAGGCAAAVSSLALTTEIAPGIDAGPDIVICPGDDVNLAGSATGPASTISWSTGGDGTFSDINVLNTIYTPGSNDIDVGSVTLSLTAVPVSGICPDVVDQVIISFNGPISTGTLSSSLEVGETRNFDVVSAATLNPGDQVTVSITRDGEKGTSELLADNTVNYTASEGFVGADQIEYEICNQCGQCDTGIIDIEITNSPPAIEPGTPPTVSAGESVVIPVSSLITDPNNNVDLNSLTVVEQPLSGASAFFDSNFDLVVDYDGIEFSGEDRLTIEVCDVLGSCTQIQLVINVEPPQIKVYNVLSPNGDGRHDILELEGVNMFPENQVVIFNRWGARVFEISNYDNMENAFDGFSNLRGKNELPNGTYYYIFKYPGGQIEGFFLLKR